LDPERTESEICLINDLTPEQVAAARAYILRNPETVLAEHLKIEAKRALGNAPEVIEQMEQTRSTFLSFKKWLASRDEADAEALDDEGASGSAENGRRPIPTFKEWLAEEESRPIKGS
jgi:hypothetical protein